MSDTLTDIKAIAKKHEDMWRYADRLLLDFAEYVDTRLADLQAQLAEAQQQVQGEPCQVFIDKDATSEDFIVCDTHNKTVFMYCDDVGEATEIMDDQNAEWRAQHLVKRYVLVTIPVGNKSYVHYKKDTATGKHYHIQSNELPECEYAIEHVIAANTQHEAELAKEQERSYEIRFISPDKNTLGQNYVCTKEQYEKCRTILDEEQGDE